MIFWLTSSLLLAQVITTGDSYSRSTVINKVEGEGQVYTRIEQEVNGEKQVYESSESGEHRLEMRAPIEENQEVDNKQEEKIGSESGETIKDEEQPAKTNTLMNQIRQVLKNIWSNLSRLFY